MAKESFEACVLRVMQAGSVSRAAALRLLSEVDDRAEFMKQTGADDPYMKAASKLAAETLDEARAVRLDALRNAAIRARILSKVTGFESLNRTLRDLLHGSNVGSRENIQSEWLSRASQVLAAMQVQLKKAGAYWPSIKGELDHDIARGWWAENAGEKADIPAAAKGAVDAFMPAMDSMRDMMNAHGARIGDAPDYAFHTWHDPMLMRRGGRGGSRRISTEDAFNAWRAWAEPRLAEKTFEDVTPGEGEDEAAARLRFLRSVFNALVSGIHMRPEGMRGVPMDEQGRYVPPQYEGTFNVARRVSQQRVLFWKDADAWFDYNSKYGRFKNLYEGVQAAVRQDARNIALMDKLGTNPAANLATIIRRGEEKFRNEDLDGLAKFQRQKAGIENVLARIDGSANIPVDRLFASFSEGARQYYDTISLGGVNITHIASSFATVPTELRHHGVGAGTGGLSNVARMIPILYRGFARGSLEHQAMVADTGAFASGLAYNLARDWNLIFESGNTPIGRVSAIHKLFIDVTGLTSYMQAVRYGLHEFASHNLARQLGGGFGDLHPMLQDMLSKYGIADKQWEQLRELHGGLKQWEGRAYLTPTDALRTKEGQALADKLLMYYQDVGDHGIVTPGVRERAALYGKERPGSTGYEMRRFLTQFKIWPLAAMNQVLGREIHMSLSAGGAAWGIGLTIALSTLAGFGRMTINDIARGNPVRNPGDPATLLAALAQGGGLGILGDLAFGEANRLGSGGISSFGGPLITDGDALLRIYGRWRENMRMGRASDFWPDLARFGVNHVPFGNLVYLKGALDYLLWYHLFEAAKPGWWERTNRRLAKETGRTMTGYTPGGGVPYGVPGVYLRNQSGQTSGLLGQGQH